MIKKTISRLGNIINNEKKYASQPLSWVQATSYALILLGLWGVLKWGLLAALFSGLLVYSLVDVFSSRLNRTQCDRRGAVMIIALISVIVIMGLVGIVWGSITFFQSDTDNIQILFQKMADILDRSRDQIPAGFRHYIPASAEALREFMTHWLREHATEAKSIGAEAGRVLAHILIGMIIGAMLSFHREVKGQKIRPLAAALTTRMMFIQQAFKKIVFAQMRISAINTFITAIFVFLILPVLGVHLAFSKTLIALTFIVGLLPVVGNLLSNSVMVTLGLAYSVNVAFGCLIFLIVIHKLEYFLNARIIGSHIHASTWELLTVLLVMESIFGIPGVIAAPVFYAYIKSELMAAELV
ncbi:MAG: AI-2E family transporter [Pseudomonadota bacterium]